MALGKSVQLPISPFTPLCRVLQSPLKQDTFCTAPSTLLSRSIYIPAICWVNQHLGSLRQHPGAQAGCTGEATDGTGAGEIMARSRQDHGVGSVFILFISIWGKVLASVETQGGGCQQKGPPVKPWNNSFSPAFVGPDSCYPNHPTSCSQPARSCRRQLYPLVIS